MVELMVALVVGLLLLAGVLQILLSNREAFDAQRGRGHLQENARLASFVLENVVSHAGFRTELAVDKRNVFPANTAEGALFRADAFISGESNTFGENDTLRVRFQGEGGVHNCRGTAIGSPGAPATSVIELYVSSAGNNALICRTAANDRQPLVEGVDRFEVRYGIDTDDDDSVDLYVSTLVGDQSTRVLSVRVQLLLRTIDEQNLLPVAARPNYTFSDGSDTGKFAPDRRGRLLLDQTIALRNALQ